MPETPAIEELSKLLLSPLLLAVACMCLVNHAAHSLAKGPGVGPVRTRPDNVATAIATVLHRASIRPEHNTNVACLVPTEQFPPVCIFSRFVDNVDLDKVLMEILPVQ